MKILPNQIKVFILLLLAGFGAAQTADAHNVNYYITSCVTPGDSVIIDADVANCPANTRYRWQFKVPGSSTWECVAGTSTTPNVGYSQSINGTNYTVTGYYTTGADNAPKLKIRTTAANAANLDGVQLRLLMRESADPCGSGSTVIYGGGGAALNEVKMYTIRVVAPGACNACVDNILSNANGYYGGFEATTNFGSGVASTDLANNANPGYLITNNPYSWDNTFPTMPPYAGNNQMVVKASTTTAQRVWYKTISVIPGEAYNFSVWAARMDANNTPNIHLRTYTTSSSTTTALSSLHMTNSVAGVGVWKQISGTYNVPLGVTSMTFAIYDYENVANEFSLDNICLTKTKDVVKIGDRMWYDANRNGSQDAGEIGVANSTVRLWYDNDGNGVADSTNPTRTDVTDASGMYLFENVMQGKYFITFTLPTGYTGFTTQDAAGVALDLNSDVNNSGQTGTHNFTEDYLWKDAGVVKGINLSGTVWNDANGDVAKASPEIFVSGTNVSSGGSRVIGTNVYVHLMSGSTILQSTQVSATGTYSFANVPVSTSGLKVVLSTAASGTLPANGGLPAYWMATGDIRGVNNTATQGSDFTVIELTTGTSDVTGQAFGIQKLPIPISVTLAPRANPGGLTNVSLVDTTFKNTDLDGTVTAMRMTKFPTNVTSLTIKDTTYYATTIPSGACRSAFCKVFPTAGVVIPTVANGSNYLPTLPIAIDPIDGSVTSNLYFTSIDNASKQGIDTAIVVVPFTVISLSGFVWNDVNGDIAKGIAENYVSGTSTVSGGSVLPGTNLYAYLIDGANKIIQSTQVSATGTFSFSNVPSSTSGMKVWLNTVTGGTTGATPPAITGITNWVLTGMIRGENNAATLGTTAYVIDVTTANANITNLAFGIEMLPTPVDKTLPIRANPGGTINVTNLDTNFKNTDPDGIVTSIRITGFPTFVTSLRVKDTTYYATTVPAGACPSAFCKVFPTGTGILIPTTNNVANLPISIDPIDGNNTVEIPFVARDNANMWGPKTALVRIPFGTPAPLPVSLISFTATKKQCAAQLIWVTAKEENTDRFEVEVSNDGKNYKVAGIVKAAGNSNNQNSYSFAYNMEANADQIFRLKMIDLNNSYSYSSVIKMNCGEQAGANILVMPNPVVNTVRVTGITGNTTIVVMDAQGRQVLAKATTDAAADMDMTNLNPGIYTMRIEQGNGEVISKKLVKQ